GGLFGEHAGPERRIAGQRIEEWRPAMIEVVQAFDLARRSRSAPVLFSPMDRGTIPRGSSPSGFGRASFCVTHPGGVMMLWLGSIESGGVPTYLTVIAHRRGRRHGCSTQPHHRLVV